MKPEVITDPVRVRAASRAARARGGTVGFVPTLGSLHEGHISLMRRARSACSLSVASVFVNPAQFGPAEDFTRYPRDFAGDLELMRRAEVDLVFHPSVETIYPQGFSTWVTVEGLSEPLCGRFRPGHFRGVATVVAKLLNIVEPDVAWFGQKDAQQALLIRAMARDLDMGAAIEICPTVREPDGLAMSSRNRYLSPAERAAAPVIHRALRAAEEEAAAGERQAEALLARASSVLASEPRFKMQYLELVDTRSLQPVSGSMTGEVLLAVAGHIGATRLIDNVIISAGR